MGILFVGEQLLINSKILCINCLHIYAYSEVPITKFPSFESYMSRSSESYIFLKDCDEAEVSNIILELHNGKTSDILIM